jgi:hypothetical protein
VGRARASSIRTTTSDPPDHQDVRCVHGPYIRPSLLFFFLSAALFNSHNSIHPLLLFATRHVIYARSVSCPLFSHHKLHGSLVGAEPEPLYNRDFALQHLVSNEYNMSDPFYRHMKGLLGSRDSGGASSTSDASPASQDSNPPNDSPTPQAINPLPDMSIEMSSSSSGDYRQRIWDYRLKTHDRWIFDLLSRDKWPQGTPCEACANLSLLFTTGSRRPNRTHWESSKNAVQHHGTIAKLAAASRACGLCALLLACFKGARQRELLDIELTQERKSYIDSIYSDSTRKELGMMMEECYGSGKLVSELRVTIQRVEYSGPDGVVRYIDAFHLADDIVRVYTEAGIYPKLVSNHMTTKAAQTT